MRFSNQAVTRPDHVLIAELRQRIRGCLDHRVGADPYAIVDAPDIRNPGDSGIWLGQRAYFRQLHGREPAYVARSKDFSPEDLEQVAPCGPIFVQGGGTFGDVWVGHQNFRERLLERFPNRPVIQLPQSIHFQSQQRLEKAARIIERHRNFLLLVRDVQSLKIARRHFQCEVELCPDMAFFLGALAVPKPTVPLVAVLRGDKEQAQFERPHYPDLPFEDWIDFADRGARLAKAVGLTRALFSGRADRHLLGMIDAVAHHRLTRGINRISRARALITDRLHVHICALLLGIPNAVLDNNYGKVRGFIAAFTSASTLTFRTKSLSTAIEWAAAQAGVALPANLTGGT